MLLLCLVTASKDVFVIESTKHELHSLLMLYWSSSAQLNIVADIFAKDLYLRIYLFYLLLFCIYTVMLLACLDNFPLPAHSSGFVFFGCDTTYIRLNTFSVESRAIVIWHSWCICLGHLFILLMCHSLLFVLLCFYSVSYSLSFLLNVSLRALRC